MRTAIFTSVLLLSAAATAADTPESGRDVPAEVSAKIQSTLKSRVPDLTISQIRTSPIAGLYEILAPDGLIYVDATGEHLVMGQIVDTANRHNLTLERWNALNAIDFETLPLSLAIKSVHGKGTRQLAVFADPECPYCQELETRLANVDDVTVYTFLFPLESVHPGATKKAHQLWCATDRSAAWSAWMVLKQMPADQECTDDPLKELAALGERLRIN